MWTPLSLFLYVSICFLTESSMYKLQDSEIKVLKFLPVGDGEECNRTCDFVTDRDGLKCNWVVIEENQNLCFYLHCLDISVCKEAAVEAVKDWRIGKYSPLKNLHHAQRGIRSVTTKVTVPNSNTSPPVNHTSNNGTDSTAVTNSSTESDEVSSTNPTKVTASVPTAGKQFTGAPVAGSSTSPSLPSLTMTTTVAPTTDNSKITIAEVSSITTTPTINSKHVATTNLSVVSSSHESTTSIINITTPVPTNSSKQESSVTPTHKLKGTTTSLRSTPITTPKTTQSLTTQLITVTPMKVSTTKPIPDTEQTQTWTNASTITRSVSQSPKTESRTTVAFRDEKSYVFPSVPAGALIKYLADTSSLMAILIFGLLFFLVSIILFAHKAFESYKRKDYVQVDYLINGMYADSDM